MTQYQRLIQVDVDEDDGESALAAVGCVTAIRRLLDSVNKEPAMLIQLQSVIYPILMHGLTPDGLDAIEDGLDCIALILYYGNQVNAELWRLLPQMLYIVAGKDDDVDGGFGNEYLGAVTTCVQNYIAKDPVTFLTKAADQTESYLELTYKFVQRILVMNQNSAAKLDGMVVLKVVITLFENLQGQIDHALPQIIGMLLAELQVLLSKKKPVVKYQSMLLQALALAFYNNPVITFQVCEQNQMTVPLFQSWLSFMPQFKLEFELRRVIFGLISILRCAPEHHPQLIQLRLQDLFKTTSELVMRQYKSRIDTLEENEKAIKEEEEELAKKLASGDVDDGQNAMDDDGDEDFEDDDAEFEKTKKALTNFKNGIEDDDDDYDEEDDEDYEYAGGDMNLYDSKLDDLDELNFMKDTMQTLF